ncbi:MAG: type II secretion system F family protein [Nanoarchaeota archaeon]
MELKTPHWAGMIAGLAVIAASFFFIDTKFFFFIIGVGVLSLAAPFVFALVRETNVSAEKEDMFLEFARNLVESVKAGTPISKSIINVRNKPYGVLSENIKKLANQISLGVPLGSALQIFSKDVKNKTISRALTLIGQAERSGGEIGGILESVTEAVSTSDKLKKERKAVISSLVVQGYIIFIVFIAIILVLQFQILPLVAGISGESAFGVAGIGGGTPLEPEELSNSFLYLLLIQGLFSGLIIGKLSEGNIKPGIKHSFILMIMAFLVSAGANAFFGG